MTKKPTKIDVVEELTEVGPGRPSEYRPAFAAKVFEYLEERQDEFYEFHKTRGEKSDSYDRRVTVQLPTREGFAKFIGKSVDALSDWEKDHPEFSGALRQLDAEQKQRLIESGLAGDYNPVIAKLLLSANHGMAEKSEQDVKHSGGVSLSGLYDHSGA